MRVSKLILIAAAVLPLACTSMPSPEGKPMPALTSAGVKPVSVNVKAVDVQNDIPSAPNTVFVWLAPDILESFIRKKFDPAGYQDQLRLRINDFQIEQSFEKAQGQVAQFFNVGGFDVYDILLSVNMEHVSDQGFLQDGREISLRRVVKISEHASLAEREKAQFAAVENLLKDLDHEMTRIALAELSLAPS